MQDENNNKEAFMPEICWDVKKPWPKSKGILEYWNGGIIILGMPAIGVLSAVNFSVGAAFQPRKTLNF